MILKISKQKNGSFQLWIICNINLLRLCTMRKWIDNTMAIKGRRLMFNFNSEEYIEKLGSHCRSQFVRQYFLLQHQEQFTNHQLHTVWASACPRNTASKQQIKPVATPQTCPSDNSSTQHGVSHGYNQRLFVRQRRRELKVLTKNTISLLQQ